MNAKTPKAKQKIADITPPSKGASAGLPQIVIEKRAHLERAEGPGADSASGTPPVSASTDAASSAPATTTSPTPSVAPATQAHTPVASKRTVITPPEDTDPTTTEASSETPETKASSTPTPASTPAATPASSIDTDIDEEPDATDTSSEAVNDIKATKEAEAAARRDQELEKFIDTKQFFVPINKEAQKRSIKVTLWLTALYIILSLMLVNLMLDTGMILLLQKLPHTNFFSV